jgi:hypothetical protein
VKLRLAGEEDEEWLNMCMWLLSNSNRSQRDKMEDAILVSQQLSEQMPTNLDGFRNHALYVDFLGGSIIRYTCLPLIE